MRRLPIDAAYAVANDAITRPCGNCGAPAGVYCRKPDGRLSRIPCCLRASDGGPQAISAAGMRYCIPTA